MRRAAQDPDLPRRIAGGGRERAGELAPATVARRWIAAYRKLVAERANRS